MHAARQQGWSAAGLAFPGHFLIRIDHGGERAIVDPFNGGKVCGAGDLRDLLKAMQGADAELTPDHYADVSDREILLRLQNNIKLRLMQLKQADKAAASHRDDAAVRAGNQRPVARGRAAARACGQPAGRHRGLRNFLAQLRYPRRPAPRSRDLVAAASPAAELKRWAAAARTGIVTETAAARPTAPHVRSRRPYMSLAVAIQMDPISGVSTSTPTAPSSWRWKRRNAATACITTCRRTCRSATTGCSRGCSRLWCGANMASLHARRRRKWSTSRRWTWC